MTEEKSEDMTLSQEILVLDFGDEKQSDFLKSDASIDFNEAGKSGRKKTARLSVNRNVRETLYMVCIITQYMFSDKTVTIVEPCPTKTSVLALGVTCALLVLIYISTIFCYYMKKWLTPRKMMP